MLVQVAMLAERASANEVAADQAEEKASLAMRSAETGVREEMEAAAVVKETESALTKALAELTFLETSYEEQEFESKADKAKAKEKAQREAEAAVKDALATVQASVATPELAGVLGEALLLLLTVGPCVKADLRWVRISEAGLAEAETEREVEAAFRYAQVHLRANLLFLSYESCVPLQSKVS